MGDQPNDFIKTFPIYREHTYDGVLMTFIAVGSGKTVRISQLEDQVLCIDVYGAEIQEASELDSQKAVTSQEFDIEMPGQS